MAVYIKTNLYFLMMYYLRCKVVYKWLAPYSLYEKSLIYESIYVLKKAKWKVIYNYKSYWIILYLFRYLYLNPESWTLLTEILSLVWWKRHHSLSRCVLIFHTNTVFMFWPPSRTVSKFCQDVFPISEELKKAEE